MKVLITGPADIGLPLELDVDVEPQVGSYIGDRRGGGVITAMSGWPASGLHACVEPVEDVVARRQAAVEKASRE